MLPIERNGATQRVAFANPKFPHERRHTKGHHTLKGIQWTLQAAGRQNRVTVNVAGKGSDVTPKCQGLVKPSRIKP